MSIFFRFSWNSVHVLLPLRKDQKYLYKGEICAELSYQNRQKYFLPQKLYKSKVFIIKSHIEFFWIVEINRLRKQRGFFMPQMIMGCVREMEIWA